MQAVILAGGLGTRLRPLTDNVPKVMVKLRGTEFLWLLIRYLQRNGINDAVICAAHLSDQIAQKVTSRHRQGITLRLSIENHPLGTAGAVKNAESLLDNEFFLINGDTYLPVPYPPIISRWQELRQRFDCLLVVYSNRQNIAPNDTAVNSQGLVVAYSKRTCQGMNYVNAGLAIVKKSIFQNLPPDIPVSLEEQVFPELISRRKIAAFITHQRYYDIGTPERLRHFQNYLLSHPQAISGAKKTPEARGTSRQRTRTRGSSK